MPGGNAYYSEKWDFILHYNDDVYYAAKYRVRWLGANPHWGKWGHDDGGDYAGNMADQIDMVEPTIVPFRGRHASA